MWRYTCFLVGLFFGLAAAVMPSSAEDYSKPGQFAVGLQKVIIPESPDSHSMPALVWYPAAGPAPDPDAALLDTVDAPAAATGPFPLVVVIHGSNGDSGTFSALGRHFASHGLVAIAADFDTGPLKSEGDWSDQKAARLLDNRPANVVRVIEYADKLSAPGEALAGVIDLARVGVWGASTGGTTAFQAAGARVDLTELDRWCATRMADHKAAETCQFVGHERAVARHFGDLDPFAAPLPPVRDARVAALVAVAPGGELHAFGDKGIAAVKLPTLIIFAQDDDVVSPELNALWAYDGIGSAEKALVTLDHGGHSFFLTGTAGGGREAAALATAFFFTVFKDRVADKATFMQEAASFSDLSLQTTLKQ